MLYIYGMKGILLDSGFRSRLYPMIKGTSKQILSFSYNEQKKSDSISKVFDIGKDFINNDGVCLILADKFFYGKGFTGLLNFSKKIIY